MSYSDHYVIIVTAYKDQYIIMWSGYKLKAITASLPRKAKKQYFVRQLCTHKIKQYSKHTTTLFSLSDHNIPSWEKWNEMNRALGHLCAHIG